jgi:hypothetical protein
MLSRKSLTDICGPSFVSQPRQQIESKVFDISCARTECELRIVAEGHNSGRGYDFRNEVSRPHLLVVCCPCRERIASEAMEHYNAANMSVD